MSSAAMFGMPGAGAAVPQQPKSRFQKFKESPLYTIALNGAFFIGGVAFIHSSLMEMLAPQL